MIINKKLNEQLRSQSFASETNNSQEIEQCKAMAAAYAVVENSLVVLSDLKEGMSYIYYGGVAEVFGLGEKGTNLVIESIWEEDVFRIVETSDFEKRNLDELQFFHFMKSVNRNEIGDYYLTSCITMNSPSGPKPVVHRIFYVANQSNGSIRFAICLYNIAPTYTNESFITNSRNGSRFIVDRRDTNHILSEREKEVLRMIERGLSSKAIAVQASISIHTVNRHRQNILSKLRAKNSFDACKIARLLNLI